MTTREDFRSDFSFMNTTQLCNTPSNIFPMITATQKKDEKECLEAIKICLFLLYAVPCAERVKKKAWMITMKGKNEGRVLLVLINGFREHFAYCRRLNMFLFFSHSQAERKRSKKNLLKRRQPQRIACNSLLIFYAFLTLDGGFFLLLFNHSRFSFRYSHFFLVVAFPVIIVMLLRNMILISSYFFLFFFLFRGTNYSFFFVLSLLYGNILIQLKLVAWWMKKWDRQRKSQVEGIKGMKLPGIYNLSLFFFFVPPLLLVCAASIFEIEK